MIEKCKASSVIVGVVSVPGRIIGLYVRSDIALEVETKFWVCVNGKPTNLSITIPEGIMGNFDASGDEVTVPGDVITVRSYPPDLVLGVTERLELEGEEDVR